MTSFLIFFKSFLFCAGLLRLGVNFLGLERNLVFLLIDGLGEDSLEVVFCFFLLLKTKRGKVMMGIFYVLKTKRKYYTLIG